MRHATVGIEYRVRAWATIVLILVGLSAAGSTMWHALIR
jgi:hypothetical protein